MKIKRTREDMSDFGDDRTTTESSLSEYDLKSNRKELKDERVKI
jgi:hypothetical protein